MSECANIVEVNISDELRAIEYKKRALQDIIRIADSVDKLQIGLRAALVLGKPTGNISRLALKTYIELSEKTKKLPTPKLQAIVAKLDAAVSQRLRYVVEVSKLESYLPSNQRRDNSDIDKDKKKMDGILTEFRKNAQTSAALRIVLQERGLVPKPINYKVSEKTIIDQIHSLEKREKKYRNKIKIKIIELQDEVDRLIHQDNLPNSTIEAAKLARIELQSDLEHIMAGKPIDAMPTLFEAVEIHEVGGQEASGAPHAASKDEVGAPVKNQNQNLEQSGGLLKQLWRWLTSPVSVTWDDTRK